MPGCLGKREIFSHSERLSRLDVDGYIEAVVAAAEDPGRTPAPEVIRQLGLAPQKAKNLKALGGMLVEQGGEVPRTFEGLEALPGVGHKTASVVMAQAFGVPAFPVDTHIHRLAQRWGLSSGKNVVQTEKDLKRLFPEECWNDLHLQIIFYGREYCTARGCDGTVCDICRTCYPNRKLPRKTRKA